MSLLRSLARRRHLKALRRFPVGARRGLLRTLESPSHERAKVIRQLVDCGNQGMANVLIDLEADELLRFRMIEILRQFGH